MDKSPSTVISAAIPARKLLTLGHTFSPTVERKDNCSGCDKSLVRAENLKTHMLIHTGEKPHKCNSCNKLFTQAGDLRQHTMTHTGEKPPKKNRGSAPFHSAPEMEILFVCLSQDFLWYTPITIKMVYLLNVSLRSPKMLSEIMRWKGFLPQCGVVEFSNDSLIACLNRRKVTLVAIVWNSSPLCFHMYHQIAYLGGCKVALVACVWLFIAMSF